MALHQLRKSLMIDLRKILMYSTPKSKFYCCASTLKCFPSFQQKSVANVLNSGVIKFQNFTQVSSIVCRKSANLCATNCAFSTSSKSLSQLDKIGKRLNDLRRVYRTEDFYTHLQLILAGSLAAYLLAYMWHERKFARDRLEAALQSHRLISYELRPLIQLSDETIIALPQPLGKNDNGDRTDQCKDHGDPINTLGVGDDCICNDKIVDAIDCENEVCRGADKEVVRGDNCEKDVIACCKDIQNGADGGDNLKKESTKIDEKEADDDNGNLLGDKKDDETEDESFGLIAVLESCHEDEDEEDDDDDYGL